MELISTIVIQILNALVFSGMLLLCAIGLTMIFGIMGVVNFAHGSFYMLGAYVAYTSVVALHNFWLALIIAPISVGIVGALLEVTTLRRIYAKEHWVAFLLTFGFLVFIDSSIQAIWGPQFKRVPYPEMFSGSIKILGQTYPVYNLFIVCVAVVVAAGVLIALQRTRLGLNIRAVSQNSVMAGAIGINVKMVRTFVFGLGCALAALSGVVVAPIVAVTLGMGVSFLVQSFAVVVVGGLGSIIGSVVGSLIIGTSQTLGTFILPEGAMVFMYVLMAGILIFRTRGLFGEGE